MSNKVNLKFVSQNKLLSLTETSLFLICQSSKVSKRHLYFLFTCSVSPHWHILCQNAVSKPEQMTIESCSHIVQLYPSLWWDSGSHCLRYHTQIGAVPANIGKVLPFVQKTKGGTMRGPGQQQRQGSVWKRQRCGLKHQEQGSPTFLSNKKHSCLCWGDLWAKLSFKCFCGAEFLSDVLVPWHSMVRYLYLNATFPVTWFILE